MNNAKKVTIHDIAKKLNITASTVSRALNDSPRISDKTKKAVLQLAKDLNYRPNNVASALRNGKTQIIGMLVPSINRAFFSSIIRGVEEVTNSLNYHVIVSQSYEDFNNEKNAIKAFLKAQVDCVIASISKSTTDYDHYQEVINNGIPLILFDRTTTDLQTSQVVIDDYQGGYIATKHLIEQGCLRILHLTFDKKLHIYRERQRGYEDALKDFNIEIDNSLIISSELQLEDGRIIINKLLESNIKFDAIFSASDYTALGCMQVLKENNIKIPNEVAIVGFLNEPFTCYTDPPISSVNQFPIEIGNTAANLFFEALNSGKKTIIIKKTVIQPELIIRDSSKKNQTNSNI